MSSITGGLMSSESAEWETPQSLFDALDSMFHFDLDPCSTDGNAKCERHFTVRENGLEQDWGGVRVFCNPPYGRELPKWVRKCYEESLRGAFVVMLIPARTDTSYWRDVIFPHAAAIGYISGRVRFGDGKHGAPFPSAIVVFGDTIAHWR